jgi:hypothetical protein
MDFAAWHTTPAAREARRTPQTQTPRMRYEMSFLLRKENEELVDLLDNRDHMLREAKKMRKELRTLLEDARNRVAEL